MNKLLILLLTVFSFPVLACNCNEDIHEMNMEKYNHFEVIFSGIVDSTSSCEHTSDLFVTLQTSYKGSLPNKITIKSADCSSSCGQPYNKGVLYLFFVDIQENGAYTISPCSGTRHILSKQEIDEQLVKLEANSPSALAILQREINLWDQQMKFLEEMKGKMTGSFKTHYTTGIVTAKGELANGIPTGKWVYYFPDGHVRAHGHYVNGKKEGDWTEFNILHETHTDGTLHEKTNKAHTFGPYVNGLKEGKWHSINADGTVHTYYYKQGRFVREAL